MTGDLWRGHPATQNQLSLATPASAPLGNPPDVQPIKKLGRITQAHLLASMLRERRAQGKALEVWEIANVGIVQHTARIFELRERGFVIENEMEHTDGRVKSRYWLRFDPERDVAR